MVQTSICGGINGILIVLLPKQMVTVSCMEPAKPSEVIIPEEWHGPAARSYRKKILPKICGLTQPFQLKKDPMVWKPSPDEQFTFKVYRRFSR
jgi:hypothetical protein